MRLDFFLAGGGNKDGRCSLQVLQKLVRVSDSKKNVYRPLNLLQVAHSDYGGRA